jgi:sigma-E factor negative regulatory protein RseA
MSDILNEQLSALLDGELPPEETALLMKRLEREPELRTRLARYGLCGGVLRGERVSVRRDFALRMSAVVAGEPVLATPTPHARPVPAAATAAALRWLKPLAGIGVAAAVAGLAVFVLQRSPAFDAARRSWRGSMQCHTPRPSLPACLCPLAGPPRHFQASPPPSSRRPT